MLNLSSLSGSNQRWRHLRIQNSARKHYVFWTSADQIREAWSSWPRSLPVTVQQKHISRNGRLQACESGGICINADAVPSRLFLHCSERCSAPESLLEQSLACYSSVFVLELAQGQPDALHRNIAFFILICNQRTGCSSLSGSFVNHCFSQVYSLLLEVFMKTYTKGL